jgi:Acetyltransferase (GNAT) family
MVFSLRALESRDLEWLRCLRNDSRDAFFNMAVITPEQQELWFRMIPYGDQRWVIWDCERPEVVGWPALRVGYFSIERPKPDLPIFPSDKPVWYLNSLLVDHAHRGRGVIQTAADAFDPMLSYTSHIRKGNDASLRACAKMGLIDRGLYHHPVYGPMHIVWRT